MLSVAPSEIAPLEERRASLGTAEIAREAEKIAGGFMCFTAPGSWSNQAAALGLSGPVESADIDRLIDFYRVRGVEPRVVLCPFADETLVRGLATRGFVVREFENVLARSVGADEDFRSQHPFGWPKGLVIGAMKVDATTVDDDGAVREFVEVSTSGFRPANQPIDPEFFAITERAARHPRLTPIAAHLDGAMVGGGFVECDGRLAALFGVSVLDRARGRGTQLALMLARLELAQRAGCDVATIASLPGIPTERNAARIGFQVAYTKVTLVRPEPGLESST